MGHAIFAEEIPIWMPKERKLRRMEVFVKLVNSYNDSVRAVDLSQLGLQLLNPLLQCLQRKSEPSGGHWDNDEGASSGSDSPAEEIMMSSSLSAKQNTSLKINTGARLNTSVPLDSTSDIKELPSAYPPSESELSEFATSAMTDDDLSHSVLPIVSHNEPMDVDDGHGNQINLEVFGLGGRNNAPNSKIQTPTSTHKRERAPTITSDTNPYPKSNSTATSSSESCHHHPVKRQKSLLDFVKMNSESGETVDDVAEKAIAEAKTQLTRADNEVSESSSTFQTAIDSRASGYTTSGGAIGVGKSSMAAQELKAKLRAGAIGDTGLRSRQERFAAKVREIDADAIIQFDDATTRVTHSTCNKPNTMKGPFEIGHFKRHISTCKVVKAKGSTLKAFFVPSKLSGDNEALTQEEAKAVLTPIERPCAGLTAALDKRITQYLARTGARSAGGPSFDKVAIRLFEKEYSALCKSKKQTVQIQQQNEHRWELDRTYQRVVSTKCLKVVTTRVAQALTDKQEEIHWQTLICAYCRAVFNLHEFKVAINVEEPEEFNYKYVNKRFQGEALGHVYLRCKGARELIESKVRLL